MDIFKYLHNKHLKYELIKYFMETILITLLFY